MEERRGEVGEGMGEVLTNSKASERGREVVKGMIEAIAKFE